MSKVWDVLIIGAGAAGLFCASVAARRGKQVLVLDHAATIGEKIRISGGGRCNFTNLQTTPSHFLSLNPHFVKSALARYTPQHFINLVRHHGIAFHEKHRGQLFCDESATQIVTMLLTECQQSGAQLRHPVTIENIQFNDVWTILTSQGVEKAHALVIATGGLPVPVIGATDFAMRLANQFQIPVVPYRPALVPLSFTSEAFGNMSDLAGLSLPVAISAGQKKEGYGIGTFDEDLLITHKGLSGPAVLQASSYWQEGQDIHIDWTHGLDLEDYFNHDGNRLKNAETVIAEVLPQRLARHFTGQINLSGRKWAEISKKDKEVLKDLLTRWRVKPAGTLGWKKAEVMLGGVDTRALDGQSMMVKNLPGLYFIGECVDVTGHLGGHNFQWAWSSAYACASHL